MLNKSIAYRLSIYISLAVIGVFIAFMLITYFFNSRNITKNIENYAFGESQKVIMEVEKKMVSTREITSNIGNQIIFYSQHNHPDLLLKSILEKYSFINAIHVNIDSIVPNLLFRNYLGYREKDSILLKQGNEIIFQCPDFKRAIMEVELNQTPDWTAVSVCPRSGKSIISYYQPIYLNNKVKQKVIGEVITELSLEMLNDAINYLDINKNGYAFFTSKDGTYLTHPKKEWINSRTIYTNSDDVYNKKEVNLKEALEKGFSNTMIIYPEYRNYKKHWCYYTRIGEAKWTLFFALPYNELYQPLYLSILKMLFFSVLGVLIIYLTITYITNKLIEPLSTATSQLQKFASLSGKNETSTLNETMLVSESLNFIQSWYEKFKIDQSQEELKSKRLKQDLLQASEIQKSLIKTDFSEFDMIKEIDIFAIYEPAKIVSGDLFDYFYIDNDHLMITMGDVSGKGVPAALFMSIAQTLIKGNATSLVARRIVKKTNDKLFTINQHQFFLTLFLGVLNIKTGVLEYCNAAHTPTYILKLNGEIVELTQSHGLPLGVYSKKRYSDSKIKLDKGDIIILYTDGITELIDENKIQFGNERFLENLHHLTDYHPEEIVEKIDKSLKVFKGNEPQADDITLMAVKYNA